MKLMPKVSCFLLAIVFVSAFSVRHYVSELTIPIIQKSYRFFFQAISQPAFEFDAVVFGFHSDAFLSFLVKKISLLA